MSEQNIFEEIKKKSNSGFRLEIFNLFIIIFTVVVTVLLSFAVFQAHATYEAFYDATEEYIACRTAAEQVHDASEYLTNEVRYYVHTGDIRHINNYFYESTEAKRREKALDTIKKYVNDNSKVGFLENAVNSSKALMEIEYYAMRLSLEVYNEPEANYPDPVKAVTLTAEDKALSANDKLMLASDMVQDNHYDNYKDKIYDNVSLYMQDLLNDTRARENENSKLFSRYQMIQLILIVALISVLMVNVAVTSIFLIRPLRKNSKLIVEQNSLPVKGPQEMRTFALLYNKVLEKTKTQQEKLSYDASHDSLTGIQNRSVFDAMYRSLHKTTDLTLVLLDIDSFKEINDTYGHEAGDGVLKRVAQLLHSSFRSDDVICRIGGDEFAIILNGVTDESKDQLQNKMAFLMERLSTPVDNLPVTTVSIGVAFGNAKRSFKSLYKNADEALYSVKSTTKNNAKFYEG